jgi:hypothetical protein
VAVVSAIIAASQANSARDEANAARDEADAAIEQVEMDRRGQAERVGFGVFGVEAVERVTVTNASTLPLRKVSLYLTNAEGQPVVEYDDLRSVGPCTEVTLGGDFPYPMLLGFQDASGRDWTLEPNGGSLRSAESVPYLPNDFHGWDQKEKRVTPCE